MKILSLLSLLALSVLTAHAGESNWLTNYDSALAAAKKANKPLLIEFTGSDWCPPCKMMTKEVFTTPTFQTFSEKNLVLLKADFPQSTPLSAEQQKHNNELMKKFGVKGFPTLVVVDGNGKELARNAGYKPGGPNATISWIQDATK